MYWRDVVKHRMGLTVTARTRNQQSTDTARTGNQSTDARAWLSQQSIGTTHGKGSRAGSQSLQTHGHGNQQSIDTTHGKGSRAGSQGPDAMHGVTSSLSTRRTGKGLALETRCLGRHVAVHQQSIDSTHGKGSCAGCQMSKDTRRKLGIYGHAGAEWMLRGTCNTVGVTFDRPMSTRSTIVVWTFHSV